MAYDALRTIMPITGWPEERAREVEISVGAIRCCRPGFASAPRGLLREGRAISRARQHTPIIKPLSLDEAYLEVTDNLNRPSARQLPVASAYLQPLQDQI